MNLNLSLILKIKDHSRWLTVKKIRGSGQERESAEFIIGSQTPLDFPPTWKHPTHAHVQRHGHGIYLSPWLYLLSFPHLAFNSSTVFAPSFQWTHLQSKVIFFFNICIYISNSFLLCKSLYFHNNNWLGFKINLA